MSIYIAGDCHGDIDLRKFTRKGLKYRNLEITKDDYVIICGDWGAIWTGDKKDWVLDWWKERPWTTIVVLGNHENYDAIETYPLTTFAGALCREICKDKIYVVERGQIITLEDKTFFCFGGAQSHDIKDGILDPNNFVDHDDFKDEVRKYRKLNKEFRIKGTEWWAQEMPTVEEIEKAKANLKEFVSKNGKVDFMISHCIGSDSLDYLSYILNKLILPDICTDALSDFKDIGNFQWHFCGHYHIDELVRGKCYTNILYQNIIKI